MDHSNTVKVYSFATFAVDIDAKRISTFKAPREIIVSRFGGDVLEGTAQEVSSTDLDEHGRYRRTATGWGALT